MTTSTACCPTGAGSTRVLLVDDEPLQLKLARIRLQEEGYTVDTATRAEDALETARRNPPDIILSDVHLGGLDGFDLCRKIREEGGLEHVPFVLVSAHFPGGEASELARRVGATRFLARTPTFDGEIDAVREALAVKGKAPPSERGHEVFEHHLRTSACEITRLIGQARSAEERYRTLFESADVGITVLSPDGVILEANERWRSLLGVDPAAMVGRHIREFWARGHDASNDAHYRRNFAGTSLTEPVLLRRTDGIEIHMAFSVTRLELDGAATILAIGRDVTDELRANRELAAAEEKYRSLVDRFPDAIWTITENGRLSFATANTKVVLGHAESEICCAGVISRCQFVHADDRDVVLAAYRGLVERGEAFDLEYRMLRSDGRWVWLRDRSTATYVRNGVRYREGITSDVTERKQLEEELRQVQRIEAIGQLTGGIAHDFNNILAAILANAEFLIDGLGENDPRRGDAIEIRGEAERGAALTRQLLAFGRRQVLQPTVVNLNAVVAGVEKMLRRLIGEDVEFSVQPAADLGSVRVDVGQLEQVIINLAVNARDAMPWGGKLSIMTANLDVPPNGTQLATPGRYVALIVADGGCGMDEATKARVFEPFFTTKPRDKGTGLGLSTCHGIVEQSGGFIEVESWLNRGSAFTVYLPRIEDSVVPQSSETRDASVGGDETVLLIEDDAAVRAAVQRILGGLGYEVLVARDGAQAIGLGLAHQGTIDLVLSDVVMPNGGGPEAVTVLQVRFPNVKALYMSGYTDHAMLRDDGVRGGVNFIQKPFRPDALASRVRRLLEG